MFYDIYKSPFCDIILVGDENGLAYIILQTGKGRKKIKISEEWIENPAFFTEVKKQLTEYFAGKRKSFAVKLNPQGTSFQKKVWQALSEIPYGEVRSYKDIAEAAGNGKACRAVGMANSRNPLPLIVPCHRVIGANGKLVGFGSGLEIKEKLLNLEKAAANP